MANDAIEIGAVVQLKSDPKADMTVTAGPDTNKKFYCSYFYEGELKVVSLPEAALKRIR